MSDHDMDSTDQYWAWIDSLTDAERDDHHRLIHPNFTGDNDNCSDCIDEGR